MKKIIFVLVTMVMSLFSCSDQQLLDKFTVEKPELSNACEFNALIEKARWGDGQAYLKLADCYRDGKGVDKDLGGMLSMVAQAYKFGVIRGMNDYLKDMPEGSDFRIISEVAEKFENKQIEEAKMMLEQLVSKGVPDGIFIQGFMAIESGDTLAGLRMMEQAASEGSTIASLMLCIPECQIGRKPDVEKLKNLSEKIPYVNLILAKMYMGEDDESMRDDRLAAHYFLKADENAYLSKREARWLLYNLPLSERDIQRLQILAGEVPVEENASQQNCEFDKTNDVVDAVDSVVVDTVEIE